MRKVKKALRPLSNGKSGLLFVKENSDPEDSKGKEDTYGWTRRVLRFERVFRAAGFEVIYSEKDINYPEGYSVHCYVARPKI